MPKKTSSGGSKKSRSDSYKSGDGASKRTKSGDKEKKKPSRSKSKVKIEANEDKTIWYQDRCAHSASASVGRTQLVYGELERPSYCVVPVVTSQLRM
jgi:hypothetical protein